MSTKKYSYKAEREVLTYSHLYKAAKDTFEIARAAPEDYFYQLMCSLVFSAFSLEAYLNHLGERVLPFWNEIEGIRTLKKLKVVHTHLEIPYDPSCRPIQTVIELFRFRNFMAHGRTESVSGTGILDAPEIDRRRDLVTTKWEQFCNREEAARALEDVKCLIDRLHEVADLGHEPLAQFGSGSRKISREE